MRILIINDNMSAPFYYKEGFRRVLEYCGHQVRYYRPEDSLFDIFYEFKPDLLYSNSYSLDQQTLKVLQKYDSTKVILRANDYGDNLNDVGPEYPIGRIEQRELIAVSQLKDIIKDRLCFVFTHYHQNDIEHTMGKWTSELGIRAIALSNSADILNYSNGIFNKELECDVSMISGYWPYKAINLNPYIFPLCNDKKLNIKIFGNGSWPLAQYLGMLSEESVKNLFVSSKINMNIHEPHSTKFHYDVNERIFKILACGGFLIGDYIGSIEKNYFTDNETVMAKNPTEFRDLIHYYLENPEERQKIAKKGQEKVWKDYTYFNQVAKMFENIGEENTSKSVKIKHKTFLQSLYYNEQNRY